MRFLHTMIRVNDLDESIRFYCDVLEMKLIRKRDYPRVISRDEASNTVIELTYNWNAHRYDLGDAFGHLGLGVDDIYKTCEELRRKTVREPGPMKHGGTEIAFVEDPNGYKIELVDLTRRAQGQPARSPPEFRYGQRPYCCARSAIARLPSVCLRILERCFTDALRLQRHRISSTITSFHAKRIPDIQEDRVHGDDDYQ